MKKTILSIAVIAAAIFAASCQKENLQENTAPEGNASIFTATIETGASTKTTVERIEGTPATYKTKWENGDQISINGVTYTATHDATDATKATFTKDSGNDPTGPFNAYFPANLYNNGTPTLPANVSEEWADGKYNMPMYATSTTTSLSFKNLCGVLKITVTNDFLTSVKSITVSSTNCATSGAFTVSGDAAVLTDASNTAKTVTVTYTEAVTTGGTGKVFYVAIPAQTYKNLSIAVSDGTTTWVMTTKSNQDIEVARNTVYPIAFKPTTGTAKATIDYEQVDVNWVQLWAGGPKFAEMNLGATSATEVGDTYQLRATDANDNAATTWGDNWCTPSKDQMNELLLAAQGNSDSKVTCKYCEYTTGDDIWGFKFTGKETGYTGNSVFFPAEDISGGSAEYWSATADGSNDAFVMFLRYFEGEWDSEWESFSQYGYKLVRPVLNN